MDDAKDQEECIIKYQRYTEKGQNRGCVSTVISLLEAVKHLNYCFYYGTHLQHRILQGFQLTHTSNRILLERKIFLQR